MWRLVRKGCQFTKGSTEFRTRVGRGPLGTIRPTDPDLQSEGNRPTDQRILRCACPCGASTKRHCRPDRCGGGIPAEGVAFDAAFFYPWIVTKQEPPVDAIFSKQSCLLFIRVTPGKCMFPGGSHLLCIVGMNYLNSPLKMYTRSPEATCRSFSG